MRTNVFHATILLAVLGSIAAILAWVVSSHARPDHGDTPKGLHAPGFSELQRARSRLVKMSVEETTRYQLDTPDGIAEWASLIPPGGHLMRAWDGDEVQTFTVAMFHQLRCLDIVRDDYVRQRRSPLLKHCVNYLRQSILCLADNHLEHVRTPLQVSRYDEATCHDWSTVYEGAYANYEAWERTRQSERS